MYQNVDWFSSFLLKQEWVYMFLLQDIVQQ